MAGLWHIFSTTLARLMRPSPAASSIINTGCWMSGRPDGAWAYLPFFSSRVCGAWSVAMMSSRSSSKACHKAWRSDSCLMAGLHLMSAPCLA